MRLNTSPSSPKLAFSPSRNLSPNLFNGKRSCPPPNIPLTFGERADWWLCIRGPSHYFKKEAYGIIKHNQERLSDCGHRTRKPWLPCRAEPAGGKGGRSKNRMRAVTSLSSTLSIGKPDPSWMLPKVSIQGQAYFCGCAESLGTVSCMFS